MFHIVLHEPEIPNNTGNIGRTCIATGCSLHLVEPLGFDTSVKALRRAGLDYWPRLGVRQHRSWNDAQRDIPVTQRNAWFFTTRTDRCVWDVELQPGDRLVFGKETAGLPADIREAYQERLVTFPMLPRERSLNLATAVCTAVYEGLRQACARGEASVDHSGNLVLPRPS